MTHALAQLTAQPIYLTGLITIALAVALAAAHSQRSPVERALFGDARFASAKEIAESGLLGSRGILVGRYGSRHLMFPGQQFVLVAAPTRSGKGVGIVIPNLLTFAGSVVVLDIKGENYARTAAYRGRYGQSVFRFAPFSVDSAKFNPLGALSDDPSQRFGEVMAMAASIYPATVDNPFWNEQAANLFVGLTLLLCETPGQPRTMHQLLKSASDSSGMDFRRHVTRLIQTRATGIQPLSDACKGALGRFAANSEAAAAGVLSSFNAPLLVFADPLVAAATSDSQFSLAALRQEPLSIYLCVEPQHLKSARVILNLFFTLLIFQNTREVPGPQEPLQCLLLMDEFTSIGRIDILAHAIAFMAGYNLRLVTIIQSIGQLVGVYGEHDTRTLLANHALRVVFAPNEARDAREISELLGATTVRTNQRSQSRGRGHSARHTETVRILEQSRPLLLPQELRALGPNQQLILLDGTRPMLTEKIRYFEDPELSQRI